MLDYFQGKEKKVEYTKNISIKLNPDFPCEANNVFTVDKSVVNFLSSYFDTTLNKENVCLSESDINSSEYSKELSFLIYLVWKYIQRYRELYSFLPDLSVVHQILFISDLKILNLKLSESKYSVLINIGSSPIYSKYKNEALEPDRGVLLSCDFKNRYDEENLSDVVLFTLF